MFDTHKLNDNGFAEVKKLKSSMAAAVESALVLMPESKDKEIFKQKIQEAMFFGTKAVAGKDGNFSEIVKYTTF